MGRSRMLRVLTAAYLWWGVGAFLASGVNLEEQGLDAAAISRGHGDYVKHAAVPRHLVVSRKLITSSWVRCKLACDHDKGCSGFKFTPMANRHLPSCEMLTLPGGNFVKPNFKVREITAKKLKHAKELVAKAKA